MIHEALLRHWQPLHDWLRADHAFRRWQNALRQGLTDWQRGGEDPGALLTGARLATAVERLSSAPASGYAVAR